MARRTSASSSAAVSRPDDAGEHASRAGEIAAAQLADHQRRLEVQVADGEQRENPIHGDPGARKVEQSRCRDTCRDRTAVKQKHAPAIRNGNPTARQKRSSRTTSQPNAAHRMRQPPRIADRKVERDAEQQLGERRLSQVHLLEAALMPVEPFAEEFVVATLGRRRSNRATQ